MGIVPGIVSPQLVLSQIRKKTVPSCKSWILCSHQTVIYYHRNSFWLLFSRIVWREERLNSKVDRIEWGGGGSCLVPSPSSAKKLYSYN